MIENLSKHFWKNYNNTEAINEENLFFKVGKNQKQTTNSVEIFTEIIDDISKNLDLKKMIFSLN